MPIYIMYVIGGKSMNENLQNKQVILKELETLLSGRQNYTYNTEEENDNMAMYCSLMKRFYLSCSTNN